jgi:ATP-dependent Clp protease ATP-binding subunit ClpB
MGEYMESDSPVNATVYRSLVKYGYDLTKMASEGNIEAVTGRDNEVQQLIEVLGKKSKNNPLLLGEPNVDIFAVVEELARRIVTGNVPAFLQGKKIIALDLGRLIAGAKYFGEFEERIEAVLEDVKKSRGSIIPYFDEVWTGAAVGGLDLASILKYPLGMGQFQCIGATRPKYLEHLRNIGLWQRQFEVISVTACSA